MSRTGAAGAGIATDAAEGAAGAGSTTCTAGCAALAASNAVLSRCCRAGSTCWANCSALPPPIPAWAAWVRKWATASEPTVGAAAEGAATAERTAGAAAGLASTANRVAPVREAAHWMTERSVRWSLNEKSGSAAIP